MVPPPVSAVVVAVVGLTGGEAVGSLLGIVLGVVPAGGTVLVVPDSPNPAAVVVTPPDTWAVQ